MKIISKFQDYYDSVLGYGHDDHICFVRHQKERLIDKREPLADACKGFGSYTHRGNKGKLGWNYFILGFCGKIYYGITLVHDEKAEHSQFSSYPNDVFKSFYNVKEMKTYINEQYSLKLIDKKSYEELNERDNRFYHWGGNRKSQRKNRWEKWDDYFNRETPNILKETFFTEKTPYYIIQHQQGVGWDAKISLLTNPILKSRNFYKVFDTFQTYQEIEMYLGGVLGNTEDNTVNISDNDMRDAKGFDNRSFKKPPTKKVKKMKKTFSKNSQVYRFINEYNVENNLFFLMFYLRKTSEDSIENGINICDLTKSLVYKMVLLFLARFLMVYVGLIIIAPALVMMSYVNYDYLPTQLFGMVQLL